MIDERIHVWNLLHDGEISAVSPVVDEEVRIFVSIPYLRRKVEPLGDSFVLILEGVSLVELRHFDGEVSSLQEALEYGGPEILSTSSEAMPISVETTMGRLGLDFKAMRLELDTGQPIAYSEVERVAQQYWSAWKARANSAASTQNKEVSE